MKLSAIVIGVPDNGSCPKTVKLFCNKNNIGFSDASGKEYCLEVKLSSEVLSSEVLSSEH
jgi:hypothetical protein